MQKERKGHRKKDTCLETTRRNLCHFPFHIQKSICKVVGFSWTYPVEINLIYLRAFQCVCIKTMTALVNGKHSAWPMVGPWKKEATLTNYATNDGRWYISCMFLNIVVSQFVVMISQCSWVRSPGTPWLGSLFKIAQGCSAGASQVYGLMWGLQSSSKLSCWRD